jgi:hypothetical protein
VTCAPPESAARTFSVALAAEVAYDLGDLADEIYQRAVDQARYPCVEIFLVAAADLGRDLQWNSRPTRNRDRALDTLLPGNSAQKGG